MLAAGNVAGEIIQAESDGSAASRRVKAREVIDPMAKKKGGKKKGTKKKAAKKKK